MQRDQFETYLRRFNAQDGTVFADYLSPDARILNGELEISGSDGMRRHYEELIWPHFVERLNLLRYVSDSHTIAVQLWTNFTARHAADTLFGQVAAGDQYDFRGVVMYELDAQGRFAAISVNYLTFVNTRADGTRISLGLPH